MDEHCRLLWWHVMLYRDHVALYTVCDHGIFIEWVFHPKTCELTGRQG